MKRILRASVGIGATIAIIFLVERTMSSFGFFDETPPETEIAADSIQNATIEKERTRKRVNEILKNKDILQLPDKKEVMVKKVYNKKIFAKDEYMRNLSVGDSIIVVSEFDQQVEVTFDLDKTSVEEILLIALEGYNKIDSKEKVRFFKPREGLNRLRIKTDFPSGIHTFRVSYCYKEGAKTNPVYFYSQKFKVEVE